ncbi:MAG TPA: tetratricopeptide repeat protein [Phototrophicaceae bacterium]|nr:tetratricopeptide repeat protein [Phototrophicaceae bacterium]
MSDYFENESGNLEDDLDWIGDMAEDNPQWIKTHPQAVHGTIRRGLDAPAHYFKTVDTLLKLLPNALKDAESSSWFNGVAELVATHPTEANTPFKIGFREVMREFQQEIGVYGARSTVSKEQLEALLNTYIKLFKVLNFSHSRLNGNELIDEAQAVANRLGNRSLTARMNQTLALYYAHYGLRDLAVLFGKQAFSEYVNLYDSLGTADAACTLAILYRIDFQYKEADFYLEYALNAALEEKHEKQFATLFYEQGVRCYQSDDFRLAQTFYETALEIYVEYESVYQIAMTQQALAQVYGYLSEFDKAQRLLAEARRSWEALDVPYEWVNSFFVESDIERLRGNKDLALRMMKQTIDKAKARIEDIPMRAYLITQIQESIRKYS